MFCRHGPRTRGRRKLTNRKAKLRGLNRKSLKATKSSESKIRNRECYIRDSKSNIQTAESRINAPHGLFAARTIRSFDFASSNGAFA